MGRRIMLPSGKAFVAPNISKSRGTETYRDIISVFSNTYYSVRVLEWLRKQDSNLRQAD